MLFMGTSDLDALINMEFVFVYVLMCPMFQSLGEFNLYQMTNKYNITILCFVYLILKLVLNLLIAMMLSTYNAMKEQARSKRLIFTFELVQEQIRQAVALHATSTLQSHIAPQ